jgi:hypothetical protein
MNKNGAAVALFDGDDQERADQLRADRLQSLRASHSFALEKKNHDRASELADAILDMVRPCPTR